MDLDPRTSYGGKVGLALAVVVLVSAGVGVASYTLVDDSVRDRQEARIGSQAEVEADLVEVIVQNKMDETRHFAESIGTSNEPLGKTLSRQAESATEINRVLYVDRNDGTVVSSSDGRYDGRTLSSVGYTPPSDTLEGDDVSVNLRVYEGTNSWVFATRADDDHWLLVQVDIDVMAAELDPYLNGTRTRVVNSEGVVLLDTKNRGSVGTQHVDGDGVDSPAVQAALDGGADTMVVSASESGAGERVVAGYDSVADVDWAVVSYSPPSTLFATADEVGRNLLVMLGIIAVLLAGFGLVVERPTIRAMNELSRTARSLRDGDLETAIESDRRDEIGEVFRTFDQMRLNLREQIREAQEAREAAESARLEAEELNEHLERTATEYGEVMAACAEGDLTQRLEPDEESDAMGLVAESFNDMVGQLEELTAELKGFSDEVAAASEEVTASAEEVESASQQVAGSIQQISVGADRQNETLQSIAEEMNSLSTTIEEIAASADQVADVADETDTTGTEAREDAAETVEEMRSVESESEQAVEAMEELQEQMGEIEEITEFITDVAEQTNILALNANIEAARAGEAGEGFAVVADQVKELAAETRQAAEEIETLVEDVRTQTETTATEVQRTSEAVARSTSTVEATVEALREIAEYAEETNTGIQEISNATDEQASSTNQVVGMVDDAATISEQTSQSASDVAGATEEQTSALSEMTDSAGELTAEADKLRKMLDRFETNTDEGTSTDAGPNRPVADDD